MHNSMRPPAMTGPPPSGIRKFYVKVESVGDRNEKYLCRICKTVVSSSAAATSNLIKHIRKHHPTEFDTYQKDQNRSSPSSSGGGVSSFGPETGNLDSRHGDKRARLMEETYDAHLHRLMRFLSSNLLSPSIVDGASFRNFAMGLDPRYLVPSAHQLNSVLLPNLYASIKGKIKDCLAQQIGICVSIDTFYDDHFNHFLIIMASYVKQTWEKESCLLCCRMFSKAPAKSFVYLVYETVVKEFDIQDKIEAVVIGRFRKQKHSHFSLPGWELGQMEDSSLTSQEDLDYVWDGHQLALNCFEDIFVEVVRNGFLESSHLEELFSKVSRVTRSLPVVLVLHKDPTSADLSLDTWSKQVNVLRDFLNHFEDIRRCTSSTFQAENDNMEITNEDGNLIKEFVEIFEAFEDASARLQSTNAIISCSQVLPIIRGLRHHLNSIAGTPSTEPIIESLAATLNEKMRTFENNEALHQASLLDPRFKTAWCTVEEIEKVKERLLNRLMKLGAKTNDNNKACVQGPPLKRPKLFSFMSTELQSPQKLKMTNNLQEQVSEEANRYLTSPCREHDLNPLEFWKGMEAEFPLIAKAARGSLCLEVTTDLVDNVFGQPCPLRKGSTLKEEEFQQLSFIRSNIDKFPESAK